MKSTWVACICLCSLLVVGTTAERVLLQTSACTTTEFSS